MRIKDDASHKLPHDQRSHPGRDAGWGRRDYLTDALGNVTGTVDESGVVENTYRYKPSGEMLAKTGSGPDPKFLWTGETGSRSSDAAFAGQYNRARHYGREQGAWTSVDPLWPQESAYVYANGNPTTWTDASGLALDFNCDDCYDCNGRFIGENPVKTAAKRVCNNLQRCAKSPSCKNAVIKCMAKYYSPADKLFSCMVARCGTAEVTCGGAPCNNLIGSNCAKTYGWKCSIHICGEDQLKGFCSKPHGCSGYDRVPYFCFEPTCGPEETFAHELSHCCGTGDGPQDQAEHIGRCIAAHFGLPLE